MPDSDLIERMVSEGKLATVKEELERDETPPGPTAQFVPPVLEGYPAGLPEPGIHFGVPDEVYHAWPALSCSGIRKLAASPTLFYMLTPWLNPDHEPREEKEWANVGKAYHARILEGREAFHERFCISLDPKDFPEALVSTDQIKAAIGAFTETVPVKPCSVRKDELIAQLEQLRDQHDGGIVVGLAPTSALKVDELKDRIREYQCEQPVKPWAKITDTSPDGTEYERAAAKPDWIRQLLELNPEAQIWDELCRQYAADNAGRAMLDLVTATRIEIAAAMIERHEELSKAVTGGHAEVSLFWYCPQTGVPMKARVDYLKLAVMVDLKSYENKLELSPEYAIPKAIANNRYPLQPSVYLEAAREVKALIREHDVNAIHVHDEDMHEDDVDQLIGWAMKWAAKEAEPQWLWVFQQKGIAPITRGIFYPTGGTMRMLFDEIVSRSKKRFRQFAETFGTDTWLDIAPINDTFADEDIAPWAADI